MGGAGIPDWLHGMAICPMLAKPQCDRLEVLDLYIMAALPALHGARQEVKHFLVAALASDIAPLCVPHNQVQQPLKSWLYTLDSNM